MRTTYIVCYDICDDKRLRKVAEICCDYGMRLQYSVYECALNAAEKVRLEGALAEVVRTEEDQVLFISLGPAEGRGERVITALGKPYIKVDAPCYIL